MGNSRLVHHAGALAAFVFLIGAAPRTLAPSEKSVIAKEVGKRLKDPESARFKWPQVVGDGLTYCGFVNAKNSYGGYAGAVPFMAVIGTPKKPFAAVTDLGDGDPESFETRFITKECAKAGYDLADLAFRL